MNNESLTSRFFTTDDSRKDKIIFHLPLHWWSRFYEYAWAAEFCKETDVVLDAACGIVHPFKFYLAEHCKAVHAVDKDERIIDVHKTADEIQKTFGEDAKLDYLERIDFHEQINFKQADITALPYKNNMFDKTFCISVLEHLPDNDKAKALKEIGRVLKKTGQIILTMDYPDTTMDAIEAMANEAGLTLAGEKDTSLPINAVTWNTQLYCFRMVLAKKK